MKNGIRDIARTSMAYTLSGAFNSVALFIVSILVARFLGKDGLGIYALCLTGVALGVLLAECGLDSVIVRGFAPGGQWPASDLQNVLRLRFLSSTLMAFVGLLLSFYLSAQQPGILAVSALIIIPRSLAAAMESFAKAQQRRRPVLYVSAGASFFTVGSAGLVLLFTPSLIWVITSILAADIARFVVLFFLLSPRVEQGIRRRVGILRENIGLLRASVPFAVIGIVSYIGARCDLFLIGALRGTTEAGVFAAADRFLLVSNLFAFGLFGSSLPAFVAFREDRQRPAVFQHAFLLALSSGALLAIGLFIAAPALMALTFHVEGAVPVLRLLAFSAIPQLSNTVLGAVLFARSHEKSVLIVLSLSALASAGLNVLIIPSFGALGAATVTVAIESMITLIYGALVFREYGHSGEFRPLQSALRTGETQ